MKTLTLLITALFVIFCSVASAANTPPVKKPVPHSGPKQVFKKRPPPTPPPLVTDRRIAQVMIKAADYGEEHLPQTKKEKKNAEGNCWRFVKTALWKSKAIGSYPDSLYAKDAADILTRMFHFKRLPVRDPLKAPYGSVLVFAHGKAGHVEIRSKKGYVSFYHSNVPYNLPGSVLVGIYAIINPKAMLAVTK